MTLPTYNSMPPLTPRKHKTEDLRDIITEIIYTHVSSMGEVSSIEDAPDRQGILHTRVSLCADAIVNEAINPYLQATQPTPTISQMSDRHERQIFTDNAERVINKALSWALIAIAVVFVGGLMYKTFVWGP
jgi:hypothetical protein